MEREGPPPRRDAFAILRCCVNRAMLICEEPDANPARRLLQALLEGWGPEPAPTVTVCSPPEFRIADRRFTQVDAVWLYVGASMSEGAAQEFLGLMEHWRCPVLLSRVGETAAIGTALGEGVVVGPPHESPDRLRLIFKAMLAQGHVIRGMRMELDLMRRHQAGLAVQIDKFDEELRLAARLQRQFLPQRLPQLPGVSFDVLFRPASYVSGDIYDVHQLSPELTGFYIADAVGHGVPAALLTMFIKQAFQGRENGERKGRILGLDELMVRLNRELLARQSNHVQFTTACYGRLNAATGELEMVRAGHPSPLLMRASGAVEPLTPDGPLLGVFEDGEFEVLRTKLEPGDRLLVYSDGFELAFDDEMIKPDAADPRHMRELRSLGRGDSREAMRNLELRLDEQAGSLHQRDDLTAILIDVREPQPA